MNVLITGGSRGLGLAIAEYFISTNASVWVFSRSAPPIKTGARFIACDVANIDMLNAAVAKLTQECSNIDCLINCAGTNGDEFGVPNTTASELQKFNFILQTNLTSLYATCLTTLSLLKSSDNGSIINIASIAGHKAIPNNVGYVAAKAGVLGLTRALALDLKNIVRVNSISPGYFQTEMTKKSYGDEFLRRERAERTIVDRYGFPHEIVSAVNFLSSESSTYVTGIDVPVDGGWLAKAL